MSNCCISTGIVGALVMSRIQSSFCSIVTIDLCLRQRVGTTTGRFGARSAMRWPYNHGSL
jgi:hypothetical protein